MSAITIDNDLVHYEALGRGRPVILLHGWLGSWRYWIPTMQQLSMKYKVYALDLWGFGDSGATRSSEFGRAKYTFEKQVELLADFIEKLGIQKTGLVGHGYGAAIGLRYAVQNADRVPRLMLINAPLVDIEALRTKLLGTPAPDLLPQVIGPSAPDYELLLSESKKTDPHALTKSAETLVGMTDDLGKVGNWSVLLHGRNDKLVPMPSDEWFDENHNNYENLHRVVLDDSNHFPMLDEATKVNRVLMEFLDLLRGDNEAFHNLATKEQWARRMR